MSVYAGPSIPTNGLVMHWDVSDRQSYPGTGTVLYDLSGNGNNGTLVNTVTFDGNTAGGILETNGVDSQITGGPNLQTVNHTIITGSRRKPGSGYNGRVVSTNSGNWLLGHHGGSGNKYYAEGWVVNGSADGTLWSIYAGIGNYSSDIWTLYTNGVLIGSNNGGAYGPTSFCVGAWSSTYERSQAQLSFLMAYNRVLSEEEVIKVYVAMRGRFGI